MFSRVLRIYKKPGTGSKSESVLIYNRYILFLFYKKADNYSKHKSVLMDDFFLNSILLLDKFSNLQMLRG